MKIFPLTMLSALLLLTLIACTRAKNVADVSKYAESEKVIADTVSSNGTFVTAGGEEQQPASEKENKAQQEKTDQQDPQTRPTQAATTPLSNPDWDKKIVKTADISLEVKRYASFDARLHATLRQFGGYIAQEEQTQSEGRIGNSIVIKVPVDQFDEAVSRLTSVPDSDKLVEKKISAEDVTMETVDTKSRMESKREVLQRYQDLLKQAKTMNEILKVQNEINEIQEQIEAASGRLAYLNHAAVFSTINLNYYQVLDPGAQVNPDPNFFYKLKLALSDGWNGFSNALIGLISLWPLLLVGFLIWMGLKRWRVSSRAKTA